MESKVIRRRFTYNPGTDSYFVQEFYRGGSTSGPREATPAERRQYQESLAGNGVGQVIRRQCEGIHDTEEGNFMDTD